MWLLKVAVKYAESGSLPLWLKILLNVRFGKYKTEDGIEYKGVRVKVRW